MLFFDINNDNTLREFNQIAPNKNGIVWFYAEWCGHCQAMKEEWEKFEDAMRNSSMDIYIAKVNDAYNDKLDIPHSVSGFPTILYFENGVQKGTHSGERTMEGFKRFVEEMSGSEGQMGGRRTRKPKKSKIRKYRTYRKPKTNKVRRMKQIYKKYASSKKKQTRTKKNRKVLKLKNKKVHY